MNFRTNKKNQMTSKITFFFIACITLMSATCGSNTANTTTATPSNPCQGNNQPFGSGVTCQCAEITYSTVDPNQKYDIYIPQTNLAPNAKRPIVIYIHGGGFYQGDKVNLKHPSLASDVAGFLQAGYAVASINYRLLKINNDTIGIKKCIKDCKDAITHIRNLPSTNSTILASINLSSAKTLHPGKIALWGSSAGAGIAMLIAFKGNTQNRPYKAVWVDKPQATYDINQWHGSTGVFSVCNLTNINDILTEDRIKATYGKGNVAVFSQNYLLTNQSMINYRSEVDILKYIDSTDPPVWIENKTAPNGSNIANNTTLNICPCDTCADVLNHHISHADKIVSKMLPLMEWHLTKDSGYSHTGTAQSSGKDFIISKMIM
jgi:hypothetical protein